MLIFARLTVARRWREVFSSPRLTGVLEGDLCVARQQKWSHSDFLPSKWRGPFGWLGVGWWITRRQVWFTLTTDRHECGTVEDPRRPINQKPYRVEGVRLWSGRNGCASSSAYGLIKFLSEGVIFLTFGFYKYTKRSSILWIGLSHPNYWIMGLGCRYSVPTHCNVCREY